MGEPEAPTDDPRVAEQASDLLGFGVGRDVEILWPPLEHQVAHRATHQIALESGIVQAVENLESVALDVLTRYGVFRPGENAWAG
jgi:hypothetical protein